MNHDTNLLWFSYQELVEQHVQWNEEIGEWQLRCVAYTGKNMRKSSQAKQER